jgi:alginate O-acetyltransferase complex protein AlgI
MLFVEPRFFLFFAIVFGLHWMLKSNTYRKYLLLLASYVFYAAWDWRFLSLIILSTVIDFWAGKKIETAQNPKIKKGFLLLSICMNLGVLGFFKYFNFFTDSFVDLLALFGAEASHTTLNIILPVGISFYTFQTMSYTIDVYRGKLKTEKHFSDFAFFVAFFPQLVAGPIVRALDFLPQLRQTKEWKDVAVKSLLLLFLIGFIKKACISDNIAFYVDLVFNDPHGYSQLAIMTATGLYAVQIYCDFSGYTDMAIAAAGLLGYRLTKNFDAPYLSASIIDFWRRWHISLSTWLRDYLYIPLGGNRNGELMRYRNLFLTMLLGGLWHGAAWTFVAWGALHGIALSLNHLWHDKLKRTLPKTLGWAVTLWFVCLCWIFFRADGFEDAFFMARVYMGVLDAGQGSLPTLLLCLPVMLLGVHFTWRRGKIEERILSLNAVTFTMLFAVMTMLAVAFIPSGYKPFIYFQF